MKGTDAYYLYQERKNDRGGWVVATIIARGPGYPTMVLFISLKSDIDDTATIAVSENK